MTMALVLLVALNILLLLRVSHHRKLHAHASNAAAAYCQQAEYWQSVLQSVPAPVIVTDTAGAIVILNDAAESLVTESRASDNDPHSLDTQHALGKPFDQVFADRRATAVARPELLQLSASHRVLASSGRCERYVKECSAPLSLRDRHMGTVVLLHDETERLDEFAAVRHARSEAERASQARDEFIATISHELRAPLVPILSWTALLRSGKLSKAEMTHGLEVIERSARLQSTLVSDLMDASRIIASKLELDLEPVNLLRVLDTVLEGVRVSAESKCIELSHTCDCDVRLLLADKNRLQQIFWNLLNNSVKFTPSGGRIDVRVGGSDTHVLVSVTDTGEGIAPEFMPRLFEKFSQGESVQERRTRGLGLGLSIVRYLVEAHGGKVTAESSGKGHGSTFTVTLPLPAVPLKDEDVRPTPVLGMPAVVTELTAIDGRKRENARLELSRSAAG